MDVSSKSNEPASPKPSFSSRLREITLHEITAKESNNEIFEMILNGNFSKDELSAIAKLVPKSKLVIFFSSTFTDTHDERNWIMEDVLPELQQIGRSNGVAVTFVDMRFGVKDENTLDHMTWISCADQILYCCEESDGIFFVSLQGDKYGYMPLPKYLSMSCVESKKPSWSEELCSLFEKWYMLDENAIAPRYVLNTLHDMNDDSYWKEALPKLRDALQGVAFDPTASDDIEVSRSVTEWEVLYAMRLDRRRLAWVHRKFAESITASQDAKGDFCDSLIEGDASKQIRGKLTNLIEKMKAAFPTQYVHDISGPTLEAYMSKNLSDDTYKVYMESYKSQMLQMLTSELLGVVAKVCRWNKDGNGIGVSGQELNEMIHHCKIASSKCDTFEGRNELISEAMASIVSETSSSSSSSRSLDVCLMSILQGAS